MIERAENNAEQHLFKENGMIAWQTNSVGNTDIFPL